MASVYIGKEETRKKGEGGNKNLCVYRFNGIGEKGEKGLRDRRKMKMKNSLNLCIFACVRMSQKKSNVRTRKREREYVRFSVYAYERVTNDEWIYTSMNVRQKKKEPNRREISFLYPHTLTFIPWNPEIIREHLASLSFFFTFVTWISSSTTSLLSLPFFFRSFVYTSLRHSICTDTQYKTWKSEQRESNLARRKCCIHISDRTTNSRPLWEPSVFHRQSDNVDHTEDASMTRERDQSDHRAVCLSFHSAFKARPASC